MTSHFFDSSFDCCFFFVLFYSICSGATAASARLGLSRTSGGPKRKCTVKEIGAHEAPPSGAKKTGDARPYRWRRVSASGWRVSGYVEALHLKSILSHSTRVCGALPSPEPSQGRCGSKQQAHTLEGVSPIDSTLETKPCAEEHFRPVAGATRSLAKFSWTRRPTGPARSLTERCGFSRKVR